MVRRSDRRHRLLAVAVALVVLATGCGDDDDGETGSDATTTSAAAATTTTPSTEDDEVDDQEPARTGQSDAAVADLAARLDVDPADVGVVSVEAVTWSDASLGCPQPGMMYPQVLTEGVRIILEVDGRQYRYHGGATGDPSLCGRPEEPHSIG
ncbi:hypothetical protein [Actinomarinicola tropica]|uniref:Uncharacterized protein n=1 Tax=Actinomarinicola tropica TaxID=2789776 RepID=A0A5Q2RQJ5_9ACTN|nr:hypothetical protein [Actinomarinicola tropica]QGG96407.1 hypothetical protein GH723_15590 [Actinomarinicola tropica]